MTERGKRIVNTILLYVAMALVYGATGWTIVQMAAQR